MAEFLLQLGSLAGWTVGLSLVMFVGCQRAGDHDQEEGASAEIDVDDDPWPSSAHQAEDVPVQCDACCSDPLCGALFDDCTSRCAWFTNLASGISDELDSGCYEAAIESLGCVANSDELSEPENVACAELEAIQADACGGQPVFYRGWRSCNERCNRRSCVYSQEDQVEWFDCYGRCKSNTLLDQQAGCGALGTTLRDCLATCTTMETAKSECEDEEAAWLMCLDGFG